MLLVLNWDPKFEKRNMDSKGKKKKDIDVFWHIHYFSTLKKKKKRVRKVVCEGYLMRLAIHLV